ncbi:MAG: hypothetical protein IJH87_04085 [Atopobiaceae bacterium]|nr:hypothetical protein [Atopobiaceae bacterium]
MTSTDDKFPQWMRIRTNDMTTPEGRFVLGGMSTQEWADYGRLMALRQILSTTPGASVDVSNRRQLASLATSLGLTAPKCRQLLEVFVEAGAIDRELFEGKNVVFVNDIFEAQESYKSRCRVNRKARAGKTKKEEE